MEKRKWRYEFRVKEQIATTTKEYIKQVLINNIITGDNRSRRKNKTN